MNNKQLKEKKIRHLHNAKRLEMEARKIEESLKKDDDGVAFIIFLIIMAIIYFCNK
jgi:hypothetical protein